MRIDGDTLESSPTQREYKRIDILGVEYRQCRFIWTWINPKHSSAGRRLDVQKYDIRDQSFRKGRR